MFQTDGPLMRAQQPAFQQRDDPMDARQQFRRVALAAQDRDLTSVVFAVERQVAQPTIRMYHAARRKDRKSTRLNSSHSQISYAVFCLKKKKDRVQARVLL